MNNYEYSILIEYEPLIYSIVKKFYNIDQNDLFQAGVVGLLKAIKKYQPSDNCKFSSYAYNYIFGEMYELYMNSYGIKYNKDYLRLYKKIEITRNKLYQLYGYEPSNTEIANILNIDGKIIEEIILIGKNIISLDDESKELALYDVVASENIDISTKILVDDSLAILNKREQDIMKLRYYNDLSQHDTAKKLGLSQVMVSRYEKNSKEKIREYISA